MSRIAFSVLFLTLFAAKSYAYEDWLPQQRHLEAASQGSDCAIYRTLAAKNRLILQQAQDAELHLSELLKVRRADLKSCAALRGIDMDGSDESEELSAEACSELYEKWIHAGFRLRAARQDFDGTRRSMEMLNSNLERLCARPSEPSPSTIRIR